MTIGNYSFLSFPTFDIILLGIIVVITSFDNHVIDEPTIEIGKPITCGVVVNRHIELNEEEKAEQKALALKRFQDEELRKLQNRNSSSTKSLRSAKKPKAVKPQENKQPELSLFDL